MTTRQKAYMAILVSFLLGAAVGAIGFKLIIIRTSQGGEAGIDKFKNELHERLSLNQEQQIALDSLLQRRRIVFEDLRKELRTRYSNLRSETRDSIRKILTTEQKPRFEDFINELDKEHKKIEKEKGPTQ